MANSVLDSVLAQYEKNSTSSNSTKTNISQEDRLKKYFSAILQKNEKSASRRIRILPTKDGSSPFVEVWYHEIQVNGQWVKLYDPEKNDNDRSPLTEVYNELISTGKNEYVLTSDEVENFSPNEVKKTFNIYDDENPKM